MTLSVRVTNSKLVNAFAEVELVFGDNVVGGLLTADSSITADSIQLGIVGRVRDNLLFLSPGKVFAQNHAITCAFKNVFSRTPPCEASKGILL